MIENQVLQTVGADGVRKLSQAGHIIKGLSIDLVMLDEYLKGRDGMRRVSTDCCSQEGGAVAAKSLAGDET